MVLSETSEDVLRMLSILPQTICFFCTSICPVSITRYLTNNYLTAFYNFNELIGGEVKCPKETGVSQFVHL